ncbi:MAG: UPF0175 family protein [Candidatus Latescibacteria bacterium]|nr:UPF0175 family protein [Candidatus Latescibacterota bacterium]
MGEVAVKLPEEILSAIKIKEEQASEQIRKLIALELYRERVISGGKAAEIAGMSISEFMELSSHRSIPIDYTLRDLEEDRRTIERLGL